MEKSPLQPTQSCLAIVGKQKAAVSSIAGYLYAKYGVPPPAPPHSSAPAAQKKTSAYMRNEDFRLRRPLVQFGAFPVTLLTARSVQRSIDAIVHAQASVIAISLLDEKYRLKEATREALSLISCAHHMRHSKVVVAVYWDSELKVTEWLASTFVDLRAMLAQEKKALGLPFELLVTAVSCEFLDGAHNLDCKNEELVKKFEKFANVDCDLLPLLELLSDLEQSVAHQDILLR